MNWPLGDCPFGPSGPTCGSLRQCLELWRPITNYVAVVSKALLEALKARQCGGLFNFSFERTAARKQLADRDLDGPGALLNAQGELAKASGNALFAGTEEPVRIRVNCLRPRKTEAYDWDSLVVVADEVEEAIKG